MQPVLTSDQRAARIHHARQNLTTLSCRKHDDVRMSSWRNKLWADACPWKYSHIERINAQTHLNSNWREDIPNRWREVSTASFVGGELNDMALDDPNLDWNRTDLFSLDYCTPADIVAWYRLTMNRRTLSQARTLARFPDAPVLSWTEGCIGDAWYIIYMWAHEQWSHLQMAENHLLHAEQDAFRCDILPILLTTPLIPDLAHLVGDYYVTASQLVPLTPPHNIDDSLMSAHERPV